MKEIKENIRYSEFYDKVFASKTSRKSYDVPFKESSYYRTWKKSISMMNLENRRNVCVLELGCGSGRVAKEMMKLNISSYVGVDFSPLAIQMSKEHCSCYLKDNDDYRFVIDDIMCPSIYSLHYTDVISTEVFEHIESDLKSASMIRSGTKVVLSLPNFMCSSHVRKYDNRSQIIKRFSSILEFDKIVKITNKKNTFFICRAIRI